MNFEDLFRDYWWLIFPIGGMAMGVFGMFSHHHHRTETLRILKSYADQGKDPPAFLLDALKGDEQRSMDYGYGHHGSYGHRRHGRWSSIVVFGALAVGFGYFGQQINGDASHLFTALALAFGVAAAAMFVFQVFNAVFGPKPRYSDDKRDRIDD